MSSLSFTLALRLSGQDPHGTLFFLGTTSFHFFDLLHDLDLSGPAVLNVQDCGKKSNDILLYKSLACSLISFLNGLSVSQSLVGGDNSRS